MLASKAERVADMGLFWSIATVSHRPEDVRAVSRWLTFTQKPRVTVLREWPQNRAMSTPSPRSRAARERAAKRWYVYVILCRSNAGR